MFPTMIWRPDLPESRDGRPLTTQTIEFWFREFPYDRLPTGSHFWLGWLLRPEVVLSLVVLYLLSEKPLVALRNTWNVQAKLPSTFTYAVALHNLLLAIFSATCAWNSWPIVVQHLYQYGVWDVYCDPYGRLWHNGLGAWSTIFYLSKYYEFLDTWILILKGKPASFLQVYHHAGIVLAMYGGVASQSSWLLFVVLLNSIIHTFMYLYFLIKTLAPRVEIQSAQYLTMAQIAQFFLGIVSTIGVLYMGNACDTQSSRFSLGFLHVYGLGLIALFVLFANQKYKKR